MECCEEGCEEQATTKGRCPRHHRNAYMRQYEKGVGKEPCRVEGCGRGRYGRQELCAMHYQRVRLGLPVGDAAPRYVQGATPQERFLARVDKNGPPILARPDLGPCWVWTGTLFASSGYAMLKVGTQNKGVHRLAYEWANGPIPPSLELDHLCHTFDLACAGGKSCPHRCCVNPAHLEPVTHRENTMRGRGPGILIYRSGRCKDGHDMTDPSNQKPGSNGRTICRTCANKRRMERYWRLGR